MSDSDPHPLLRLWRRWRGRPGGRAVFAWILGRRVPYTGTIRPRVLELEPGSVRVALGDRRAVRNHLDSIHAVALTNLGELATGLAVTASLPARARGIPIHFEIDFLKKARGTIEARCSARLDAPLEERDVDVEAELSDAAGDTVARFIARWRVGPRS